MNLLERIDHWATVAPDAIAHKSADRSLTYGQLHAQSNALGARLVQRCRTNRGPVAVLGHREPEMLIAFLGVVKSGRPYIPIDTALPPDRIEHILASANPSSVLTPPEIAALSQPNELPAGLGLRPDDPFYIIFTSGSTGQPKGIVITRAALEHFVSWMLGEQKFVDLKETFLNQAPFSFDLSVMDLYCSLASGGTLFSISRDLVTSPKLLFQALAASLITTWVSTPSFAEMCLMERTFDETMLPNVRRFLFCGETLLPATARHLHEKFPKARVWNFYGPTEATVATTSIEIDPALLETYPVTLPVGRAAPGTSVFLSDAEGKRPGPNDRGEIVIAGPNVSPGYWELPHLTAARFQTIESAPAYRTGDWGRFKDGLLFFEGRMDGQIKLNGYRIEIGDVEANLRALPLVRDAVVLPVARNGRVHSLAGFVVPSQPNHSNNGSLTSALRTELRKLLPAYMLPRRFVILDAFPMTANGKVDRRKLAESL